MNILTARQRTLTVSGTISAIAPTSGSKGWPTVQLWLCRGVTSYAYYGDPAWNPTLRPLGLKPYLLMDCPVYGRDLQLQADVGAGHPQTSTVTNGANGVDLTGTYTVSVDMEEYATPSGGRPNSVTAREGQVFTFLEIPRVGGTISCSITINGHTVTDTATIDAAFVAAWGTMDYYWKERLAATAATSGTYDVTVTHTMSCADGFAAVTGGHVTTSAGKTETYSFTETSSRIYGTLGGEMLTYSYPFTAAQVFGRVDAYDDYHASAFGATISGVDPAVSAIVTSGALPATTVRWAPSLYMDCEPATSRRFSEVFADNPSSTGPLTVNLAAASLLAAGEDTVDTQLDLLLWRFGSLGTIQHDATQTVDPCTTIYPPTRTDTRETWYGEHAETLTVDSGIRIDTPAGGSSLRRWFGTTRTGGTITVSGHPARLEAWRYLEVTLSGPACTLGVEITDYRRQYPDTTIVAHTKTWSRDHTGAALTPGTFIIDLCNPDSETANSDTCDTSYPLYEQDGPYYGVTWCYEIAFTGLAGSSTYRCSLIRGVPLGDTSSSLSTETSSPATFTLVAPDYGWMQEVAFSIPAGTYTGATWHGAGVASSLGFRDTLSTGASWAHGVDMPDHADSWTGSVGATADQLEDINAAAGGSLSVMVAGRCPPTGLMDPTQTDAWSSFTLELELAPTPCQLTFARSRAGWRPIGGSLGVRGIIAVTEGRQSLELMHATSLGATAYVPVSSIANYSDGWSVTVPSLPVLADPCDLADYLAHQSLPVGWLKGGGRTWDIVDGWLSGIGLNAWDSIDLDGQVCARGVNLYPGCGDVFGHVSASKLYSDACIIPCYTILRGGAHGLVFDADTGLPVEGAVVTVTESGSSAVMGVSASDDYGWWASLDPFLRGERTATCEWGSSVAAVPLRNRKYSRAVLKGHVQSDHYAIECCSEAGWVHVGALNVVRTYHAETWELVFESDPWSTVDQWSGFSWDRRRGVLYMLGIDGAASPYTWKLYASKDGGKTGDLLMSITARSAVERTDSERGAIVALYENSANVKVTISVDGGATWSTAADALLWNGATSAAFTAQLLSISNDPRRGNLVMTVDIGGAKKVLESHDLGRSWTVRLS